MGMARWAESNREAEAINRELAALMESGSDPGSMETRTVVARHLDWIRNFFGRLFGRRQETVPVPPAGVSWGRTHPEFPQPAPRPMPNLMRGWQWFNSPRMGGPSHDGDKVSFDFIPEGEAHMLLRSAGGPLPIGGKVKLTYWFDGTGSLEAVEGDTPTVSLMLQRDGDDWFGGRTGKASYRFYRWGAPGSGRPIVTGTETIEVPLVSAAWRNVHGHEDAPGFASALANAERIGLAFGDPGAGATAHATKSSSFGHS